MQALENEYGHEFRVLLNNVCVDLDAVRSLLLLHEIMNIKCEVQQENDWFLKITSSLAQPLGTPSIDPALIPTFCSMLQDSSENFLSPNIQLKTCEIKQLAAGRWVSDMIVHCIASLLNDSNPDIFAFYYNRGVKLKYRVGQNLKLN